MEQHSPNPAETVSNLVATWDAPDDGGGSFEPESVERVVERAMGSAIVVEQIDPDATPNRRERRMSPPERYDASERTARRSAYELLHEDADAWSEQRGSRFDEDLPHVDYDLLHRREIAKELLRARLVRLAEQREHRSAYEIVFIMLAAAVAILLAAPPLVQVLLAAHGTQV